MSHPAIRPSSPSGRTVPPGPLFELTEGGRRDA